MLSLKRSYTWHCEQMTKTGQALLDNEAEDQMNGELKELWGKSISLHPQACYPYTILQTK